MARHHYQKCNPESDFGYRDLIYKVMVEVGTPMFSNDVWAYAVEKGYDKLLYRNGETLAKTPHATVYARMSEEAKRGGFLKRTEVTGRAYLYELVPGKTPKKGRKLDYKSKNVYVYALYEAETEIPFYVGMGVGQRKDVHLVGESHSPVVNKVVSHLRSQGRTPVAKILEQRLDRHTARKFEAAYIKEWGRRSYDLTGVLFNQKA
jgi:hypothetical protein